MRKKLIASLNSRFSHEVSGKNPLKYLSAHLPFDTIVDLSISAVYLYTRTKKGSAMKSILFTEVICAIGHTVRDHLKLKRDSGLAAKTGAFVLYSFEIMELLKVKLGAGANRHQAYIVEVLNEDMISAMWDALPIDKVEKLPSLTPYADWVTSRHESGVSMIKTNSQEVLGKVTPETHPMLFDSLNKSQRIGWVVNDDIYPLYAWALRNKTEAFADIWEMQSVEAKTSKIREATAIGSIAKRLLGKTYYHMYTYDFRGRKYCSTAYLHEQGTDLAKGLIMYAKRKPMTEKGFFWLMVSIASNWAGNSGRPDKAKTDKIPLKDRVQWSIDNEEILLSYVEAPKENQDWMKAEKPWQFLAACFELARLRQWQAQHRGYGLSQWKAELKKRHENVEFVLESGEGETYGDIGQWTAVTGPDMQADVVGVYTDDFCSIDGKDHKVFDEYGYPSGLIAYIDGSNNGSQHLSALTNDEITAPHVNLVPSPLPGDLYKYVADHVWTKVEADLALLTREEIDQCNEVINTIIDLKSNITRSLPKTAERQNHIDEMSIYRDMNAELIRKASPVFWGRIKDGKEKRKICKRGVMVLPYGGTPYGLGQQCIEDARKHGIPLLLSIESVWGSYMGRSIYDDCRVSLKRPTQLLSKFEAAGALAEKEKRFLKWTVPVTNFPVIQHYTEGTTKKIWVQYGPPEGFRGSTGYFENTYQLAICFLELPVMSARKQAQGASPNAIHSLDAAHLNMTVCRAQFDTTTIHDSFGCALADMADLFVIVRETFVELYKENPLKSLMEDIGGDLNDIEFGTLDVSLVLESEYAFA